MDRGTIFVVDDNPNNLELLERVLSKENYQVRLAKSGKRALEAIQAAPPELILLDINMPGMDGYTVCKHLKKIELLQEIPIIFVSALDDVFDKVKAFQMGAVDYVTKPFQSAEVLARIDTQLKLFRLQKQLHEKNRLLRSKNEELLELYVTGNQIFNSLADILPGMILDKKYRIEEKIGQGGFSAVFKGFHLDLNRSVAIKILQPHTKNTKNTKDSKFKGLEDLRREGISTCQVQHPNAICVYDFAISGAGFAYMIMELLQGRSFKEELEENHILQSNRCLEVIKPVCDALAEAHASGIIHCDIKPENIFLHRTKTEEIVKVLDFGIARFRHKNSPYSPAESLSDTEIFGTPSYMAPERLANTSYNEKADIYSVGVLLYRSLSGKLPFMSSSGSFTELIRQQIYGEPIPPRRIAPWINPPIEQLLLQTLSKDPQKRPSASLLAQRLIEVFQNKESRVENLSATQEIQLPSEEPSFGSIEKEFHERSQTSDTQKFDILTGKLLEESGDTREILLPE
jgi:serine/threonine protein kinase/ActR/RegA family two-component response regulator